MGQAKLEGIGATGLATFDVEGTAIINGSSNDISGSYQFSTKFRKTDKRWQISEITIANNQ